MIVVGAVCLVVVNPEPSNTTEIRAVVSIPDEVVKEIEDELRRRGREGDRGAFIDLATQRLSIEFENVPVDPDD